MQALHQAPSAASAAAVGETSSNTPQTVEWIDMHGFIYGNPEQRRATAMKFGRALADIGFATVSNIGINPNTVDRAYNLMKAYFAQSEEEKKKLYTKGEFLGYKPFGEEHAKYTDVPDLKEFFHTVGPKQPEDMWPSAEIKEAWTALYVELETAVKHCLVATAIYLRYEGEEERILADLIGDSASLMRPIHYPPMDAATCPPGAVRSAEHEDIDMMTVIPRATQGGLQVKTRKGDFIEVPIPPGAAVINAGDTLQRITAGMIPSTTHRVVNPPSGNNVSRYSVPFFGQPAWTTVMSVLKKCRQPNVAVAPDIEFGVFLKERLRAIGLE